MCWSKIVTAGIIAAGIALFSGCGGKTEKMEVSESLLPKPVSIINFTFDGSPSRLTFSKVPQRVVVTRPEILDVLIRLGVGDKVVAASFPMNAKDRIPYYKEKIPHALIVEGELDKETALIQNPDFIIGWRMSFREGVLGDVSFWKEKNIPVYIEENSGPVPAVDPFPPCTVDSEMNFIRNMGAIFDKEETAAQVIDEIESVLRELQKKAKGERPVRVLTIEFMGDKIEVFGDKLLSGDIIKRLGSFNINYEVPFISAEELRIADPDVIFLIYHGGNTDREIAKSHFEEAPLFYLRAVQMGRIYPLEYKYVCATNVKTGESIDAIYKGLYE